MAGRGREPLGRSVSPPTRVCPDGGTCHHACPGDQCFRVIACSPLSGVYPDDDWPDTIVAEYGGARARPAEPSGCVERDHADEVCPAMAEGDLPDTNVLWRVLRKTGNPLAIVRACAFTLHEDNAHLTAADLADLATLMEFMVERIERDGL